MCFAQLSILAFYLTYVYIKYRTVRRAYLQLDSVSFFLQFLVKVLQKYLDLISWEKAPKLEQMKSPEATILTGLVRVMKGLAKLSSQNLWLHGIGLRCLSPCHHSNRQLDSSLDPLALNRKPWRQRKDP